MVKPLVASALPETPSNGSITAPSLAQRLEWASIWAVEVHIAVKRLIFSTSRRWHRVQGHSYGLRYIFNALRFDIVASVYLIEPKVPFSMEVCSRTESSTLSKMSVVSKNKKHASS